MNNIINRKTGEHNIGSLTKLFWIEKEAITAGMPVKQVTPFDEILDTLGLVRAAGYGWKAAEFIFDSIQWLSDEEMTPNGVLYKEKIILNVAKHYHERRANFDEMEYREFVVFVQDFNGMGAIFGYDTIDGERCGMRFSKKKDTGQKRQGLNHYAPMFYMESYAQPWPAVSTDPSVEYDTGLGGGA